MTPEELAALEQLARQFRIIFINELRSENRPQCHETTLRDVKKLAEMRFESYGADPRVEEDEPWRVRTKSLAEVLVEKAERLMQCNENTWRHACEPIIMGRLSSEVCW